MHLTETMYLDQPPATVFEFIADLDRYPSWMRLVHRAEPEPGSDPAAWSCELRAKVGPFARSKRLRMERSEYEQDRLVAFERAETDGRTHARWAMRATTVAAGPNETADENNHTGDHRSNNDRQAAADPSTAASAQPGTRLTIELIYGGDLWTGGLLDRILEDEVKKGRAGLQRAIEDRAGTHAPDTSKSDTGTTDRLTSGT